MDKQRPLGPSPGSTLYKLVTLCDLGQVTTFSLGLEFPIDF